MSLQRRRASSPQCGLHEPGDGLDDGVRRRWLGDCRSGSPGHEGRRCQVSCVEHKGRWTRASHASVSCQAWTPPQAEHRKSTSFVRSTRNAALVIRIPLATAQSVTGQRIRTMLDIDRTPGRLGNHAAGATVPFFWQTPHKPDCHRCDVRERVGAIRKTGILGGDNDLRDASRRWRRRSQGRGVCHLSSRQLVQRKATSRGRTAGNAMIDAASAGEMIPDRDHVVCIILFARGNRRSGTSMA